MGKIFSRLGWPVALLLLVITLSIGIYIIINQPITDDNADISKLKPENKNFEKKLDETNNNEDINKNVSSEQNLKSDQIQNDEKDLSISQNIESKELDTIKENSITIKSDNNLNEENLTKNTIKDNKEFQTDELVVNQEIFSKQKKDDSNILVKEKEFLSKKIENDSISKNEDLAQHDETKVDILRVDKSGITVIAGNAEPSTTVEAKIDEKTIGKSEVDEDGGFTIVGEIAASSKPQELKIITKADKQNQKNNSIINDKDWVYETKSFLILPGVINNKNNIEQDQRLNDLTILEFENEDIVVKQENKPINVEKLTLDRIKYSENGTAILFGRARANMNILVYLDNSFQTKTKPSLDGGWTLDLGVIKPGIYQLRIDETTANGEVKFRIETPFKQETKDLLDKMFTQAITVQPGNSLWRIARRIYGRGIMYIDIYNKNSHLIKDPNLIYPGQIFSLLD